VFLHGTGAHSSQRRNGPPPSRLLGGSDGRDARVDGAPVRVGVLVARALVFRTAEGTKLSGTVGHEVAYECDGLDPTGTLAWSVVIKGHAHEVTKLHESLDSLELPLFPWHSGPKPRIVRVQPDEVQGRRFPVAAIRKGAVGPHASEE